ncbi:MAG TPA: FkbM family methyltransferase [Chromatiales bacterium]|nr:FkbM family methyltransferase [Chromatiales bacterium]HEX22751.1 FkbM family methyltransferase [Chromatiales bacterium]
MVEISLDKVFPAALFLERQGQFHEAENLLREGYRHAKNPMFLFEAAGILASKGNLDEARNVLNELLSGQAFEPANKFLAVLNFIHHGGDAAMINDAGIDFLLPITGQNWEIEYEWINGRFYEPNEIAYLKEHIPPNSTFLDIGSNVGNHAVFIAKHRPDVQVVVFEPEPRGVEILKANMAINKVDNVDMSKLGFAVSASEDPISLQFRNSVSSTRRSEDSLGIKVPSVTLSQLLNETTRFVKMDIEGMEKEVLQPAIDKLREHHTSVMLEVLAPNRADYDQFICENGLIVIDRIPMHAGENIVIKPA